MAVQTIRSMSVSVGRFAKADSLRRKAEQVVLKLQESRDCDNHSREAEEVPAEWSVVESWGRMGFLGSDSRRGDQGGTEAVYSGADKSAAIEVLWERVYEWRAHGYTLDGAWSSEGLETLVWKTRQQGKDVQPSACNSMQVDLDVEEYGFGCSRRHVRSELLGFDQRCLRKLGEFAREKYWWSALSLGADGTRVALGTCGGEVIILDLAEKTAVRRFTCGEGSGRGGNLSQVEFSLSGQYVTATTETGVFVWDIERGKLVVRIPGDVQTLIYTRLRFIERAGEELLYLAHLKRVEVLDVADWHVVDEYDIGSWSRGSRFLSPDGVHIAQISDPRHMSHEAQIVSMWNLRTGAVEWEYFGHEGHQLLNWAACFDPSGTFLALGETGRVTIWRAADGGLVRDLRLVRDAWVHRLAFSPDGRVLLVGLALVEVGGLDGDDMYYTFLSTLWDWEWGTQLGEIPKYGELLAFSAEGKRWGFSGEGPRLVVADEKRGEVWGFGDELSAPAQGSED